MDSRGQGWHWGDQKRHLLKDGPTHRVGTSGHVDLQATRLEGPGIVAMKADGQLAEAKDIHRVRPDVDRLDSSLDSAWPWAGPFLSPSLKQSSHQERTHRAVVRIQ